VTFANDDFAPVPRSSPGGALSSSGGSTNLGDILERVLDKGLVIAGDIRVNLLDIELLTIKLRLVVASLETAKEVGIDWWESDPWLSGKSSDLQLENERLRARIERLEAGNGQREVIEARRAEPEDVD
jgi:Gas vesicle protein